MVIKWNATKEEHDLILAIANRAVTMAAKQGCKRGLMEVMMDITATHLNSCPLRLAELLDAPNFDFSHDVFGIDRHINRDTGKLEDGFLPRYAV